MARLLLFTSVFLLCLGFERLRPLRVMTQGKVRRVVDNLTIGVIGWIAVGLTLYPFLLNASVWVEQENIGIMAMLPLPVWARYVLTFLALDYTLYIWHLMNHRVPFLWRFHLVHHVDLDLDVSTASRFHAGELLWSVGFRFLQIVALGVEPAMLIAFEIAITTAAQFHHSNIRLPFIFEKWLNVLVVTPRMHGIHHSIIEGEQNANFSTIFSFWDRLHRSMQLNIPQSLISIGVAALSDPKKIALPKSLMLPFGHMPERYSMNRQGITKNKTHMAP